jgi:acyl-homoserine-lactone acylase
MPVRTRSTKSSDCEQQNQFEESMRVFNSNPTIRNFNACAAVLACLVACGEHAPQDDAGFGDDDTALGIGRMCANKSYCAEVRRTSFGVPHVKAGNEKGLGYGIGYAFAQDNFCLLADAITTSNGERSKFFGSDQDYESTTTMSLQDNLSSDFYFKYLNSPELVAATWAQQPTDIKDLMRGYAAGVNRYLHEVGSAGLPEACSGQAWVRDITEQDLIRVNRRYTNFGSGGLFINELYAAQTPAAALESRSGSPANGKTPVVRSVFTPKRAKGLGSNGVALGRDATESGAGLLLANPHFPWATESRFYQMHLTIPGKVDVMGASLPGYPVVNIGYNANVAWTHTINSSFHYALYILQLDANDRTRYVVDGKSKPLQEVKLSVDALDANGAVAPVSGVYYLSEFGPVVQWQGDTAVAVSDANFDNQRSLQQWWAMNKARSLAELKRSVETTIGLPWVNVVATDKPGNTYYGDVTPVPNVPDAVLGTCLVPGYKGLASEGLYVLMGSNSACKVKNDAGAPQKGIFAGAKLPSLESKEFVQNSNDSAWLTNPAQPLTGFPPIVSVDSTEQNGRTRLGVSQIYARLAGADGMPGNRFDMASLESLVLSNRSMYSGVLLDDLRAACVRAGVVTVEPGVEVDLSKGCQVLAKWDGTADLESVGWPLFLAWRLALGEDGVDFWRVPFDGADPLGTPLGLKLADAEVLATVRSALGVAMLKLEAEGVDYSKPWGEVQVAVRGDRRIPIHGGEGDEIYNAVWSRPLGDGQRDVFYGSSALWVVSFEDASPRAQGFLTFSQSSDPTSPFFADQTERFSRKEWIDFPFSEAAIRADANYSTALVAGN